MRGLFSWEWWRCPGPGVVCDVAPESWPGPSWLVTLTVLAGHGTWRRGPISGELRSVLTNHRPGRGWWCNLVTVTRHLGLAQAAESVKKVLPSAQVLAPVSEPSSSLTWPLPDPSSILWSSWPILTSSTIPTLSMVSLGRPRDLWPCEVCDLSDLCERLWDGLPCPGPGLALGLGPGLGPASGHAQWHGDWPAQILHPHRQPEQRAQVIWRQLHWYGERWSEIR